MKLVPQSSPYIRKNVSVKRMMIDVIIALMPITLFAIIQNGWAGIYVFLVSIVTMLLVEIICHAIQKWPSGMKFKELFTKEGFKNVKATFTANNITAPLISSLIFALLLPAYCPVYVVFIGALFGMLIGKMVFGGLGANIFNPAATGRIFVGICFGTQIGTSYPKSPVYDAIAGATPLGEYEVGGYSLMDLFLGNVPGAMGEVSTVLILVGAIYLFIRRSADLRTALSYFLSFALVMLIASVSKLSVEKLNVFDDFLYQIMAGGVMFGAVFMVTDPVTTPVSKMGRVFYGVGAGLITALIRVVGAYPEGVAFSILIMNMLTPTIDHFMRGKPNTYTWKQILVCACMVGCVCLIVSSSVMGGWF